MSKFKLSVFLGIILSGCGLLPKQVVTVEVPIAVECTVGDRPVEPVDAYGKKPGVAIDDAIQMLKADRAAWERYGRQLDAATAGCW